MNYEKSGIYAAYEHGLNLTSLYIAKFLRGETSMKNPGVLVVASDRGPGHEVCSLLQNMSYHPGLEEVHLLACLVKPLDMAELCFILKTISQNLSGPAKVTEA
jgi:hypothetical protein